MRVAALFDIHANLPALEAVLADDFARDLLNPPSEADMLEADLYGKLLPTPTGCATSPK